MNIFIKFARTKVTCKHVISLNELWSDTKSYVAKDIAMDVENEKFSERAKTELRRVLNAGLCSVMPSVAIKTKISYDGRNLLIDGTTYPLTKNVHIVGFGKAVAGMAYALMDILGPRLNRCLISVPASSDATQSMDPEIAVDMKEFCQIREHEIKRTRMLKRSSVVEYYEGAANNQPDDASYTSTRRVIEFVHGLGEADTLIALVSGGGSALLFAPKPPLNIKEKQELCKRLQNAGANIQELNTVRKQMSRIKGGGLARMAYPANVLGLVLSDVVGDDLQIIASGPTAVMPVGNRTQAIRILENYNLYHTLTAEIRRDIFEEAIAEDYSLIEDNKFKFVKNIIIGNNELALKASAEAAKQLDLEGVILSNKVEGNVSDISIAYALITKIVCHTIQKRFLTKQDFIAAIFKQDISVLNLKQENLEKAYEIFVSFGEDKSLLLLAGGEPTVLVFGDGKGGRNQELALQFSLDWLRQIAENPELSKYHVQFLSAATDGQDGPTDAAGAFGGPEITAKLTQLMKNLKEELKVTTDRTKLKMIDSQITEMTLMSPETILQRNDTYNFYAKFEDGKSHLKTGLTGTNVMDLHYIYIKKKNCECNPPEINKTNAPKN